MIGENLLHYRIVEKLGEGGMGEVYRAHDTKLGRDVALKLLPADLSSDPERGRRFEHEARVVAALNHPNIVTIHSVDEVDGRRFITMELVEGKTLRDFISSGGMSLGRFFSVAVPLVDAMCSAHAQGITHRDLKPANIMLNEEGRLKVLDFGLAKLFQEAAEPEDAQTVGHITGDGQILGTVSYMSPEQVEGKPLDGRSDIFSLGIIFYEMLTGSRPFRGDSNASTISAILRDMPPLVTDVRETLPHHLGRIVRRCLAKEPERRYQSPVDLRNDLQELAEEVDSGELGPDAIGTSPAQGATASSDAPSSPSSESVVLPGTRNMYRWILGAVGILAVALVAWLMTQEQQPQDIARDAAAVISTEGATLGVVGFENLSDPEDRENLGRVLMGLVTTGLAEPGGLKVASTAKILAARRQVQAGDRAFDLSLAPEAARNAGATVMLVGQVIRDGEGTILTAELVDVASGNALGSIKKEAATNSELFELAGAIAHDVRELMGATSSGAGSEDIDLAASITDSPEAYRQFTAGEIAVHQGKYDEAVDLFNQAIRIDPTFAMAYLRILLAYTWNGETDKGVAVARRGLQYIDRLPERWRIVYEANVDYYEGRPDDAYDKLIKLVETNPDIPDAYNLLGEIVTHFSKYLDVRRARDYFVRALEIDPSFEVVLFHLVEDYIALNDAGAIERLIDHYRERNPTDQRVLTMEVTYLSARQEFDKAIALVEERVREGDLTRWRGLASNLALKGDWERALELSQQAVDRREKGYNHAWALQYRGQTRIGMGRIAEGLTDLDGACATFAEMGGSVRWADAIGNAFRRAQSLVLCGTGDFEGAVSRAKQAVEMDPRSTWARQTLVHAYLLAGETAAAERTLEELRKIKAGNQNPSDASFELLALAELEASRGNARAATDVLTQIEAMPIELRDPWSQWQIEGDVKTALGDYEGAAIAYRKVLESRDVLLSTVAEISSERIPVLFKLAKAEELSGRSIEAKRYYQAYLDRWGDADVEIPNVAEGRRRLAAMGDG